MFELLTFKIGEIDDAFLKKYYNFSIRKDNIEDTEENFLAWKNKTIVVLPLVENHLVAFLMQKNEVAAIATPKIFNKKVMLCGIDTDLKECSLEIANLFTELFLQNPLQVDFLNYGGVAKTAFTDQLFNILKAETGAEFDYYSLNLQKVDKEVLVGDILKIEHNNQDCRLDCFSMIPDNYIEDYCTVHNEILREIVDYSEGDFNPIMPEKFQKNIEESRVKDIYQYFYLAFNKDNQIIGFTRVVVNKNNLILIPPYQMQTGVLKAYRGRKIACWLKMAMVKKLIIDYPLAQEICTDTSSSNEIMNKLNQKLGFQYSYTDKSYKLDLRTLKANFSGCNE